ncbi:MAG: SpoIIE family protein phosphatase [Salinivirgaceae bacterium]|nr:SpoIIE family protein phosphatase [Salinivirgaceae bacterium]
MKRFYVAFTACILLFVTLLPAQQKDIVFEQITNESGRSLGFITGIVQDETGFMWFATRNGLYRYNGYSYKLFKNNRNDSLSLPYNNIASLHYDNHKNLWLRHFDQLSVFKDGKRQYVYQDLLSRSFDMEVEVVQDRRGNYWVGPTGKGVMFFDPATNKTIEFTCPPATYTPSGWRFLDSLLVNRKGTAEIPNPGISTDTSIAFNIPNDGYYLIASSGESDSRGVYDFGSLFQGKKVIWELTHEKSLWTGGEDKNRFGAEPVFLKKGAYQLKFVSDISHSCGSWEGAAPDKLTFCGVKLLPLSNQEFNSISSNYLSVFKDSTYIESQNIKDILVDNDGDFWFISDKGLHQFNYKKGTFNLFPIDFKGLLGNSAEKEYLRLYQDKKGIFWIGSSNGLIRYDHLWSRFMVFQNSDGKEVLTSNSIYSIFEDNFYRIWIGTDRGLNIYDQERKTIQKITANNHNRLYDDHIIQIFEDKGGNIWVATFEGLNRLIPDPFNFTDFGIETDNSYPVAYDESANIWYAIQNKIYCFSRSLTTKKEYRLPDKIFSADEFTGEKEYFIADMIRTHDNYFWLAIDNKICRYNLPQNKVDYTKVVKGLIVGNDSLKNNVKKLLFGTSNKIYAFCPDGFYEINHQKLYTEAFYSFNQQYDFIEDVDQGFFKTASIDKKNNLWIRTSDGIYHFNTQEKKLEMVYEFSDEFKNGPLSKGNIDIDSLGNLWFATMPELHRIEGGTKSHQSFTCTYENEWGTAHCKVGKNAIWIYSSNGVYGFRPETNEFQFFSVENGLIDNNINGLEEDNLGNIWVTSGKGLSKIDTMEQKAKNFFTEADFSSHLFLGNPPDFESKNGEIILFTTKGFVSFFPDSINRNEPKVVIDKFTIRGKEFEMDSIIRLKYNQNFLGFEFAVLDYTDPAQNKYKYKLDGLDEDWNFKDADDRRASYSGLSPGEYVFMVCGSNNDKVWNEQGTGIRIIISPPWYKTTFAYIIYILLTASGIWMFIVIRERNLKEEKRILEQKVRERTAEIAAKNEELATQNEKIAEQNKNITDSIQYARRIQAAILPPTEQIEPVIDEYFILYRPRDIVSGDYYWVTRHEDITIIVAADCTGHGVPGAFMSMLGVAFLNEIVNKEGIVQPNLILDRLREQVIKQLHQTGKEGESKDGMDISLYVIDHKNMKLRFSGAYNPLYVIRNGEVIHLKADRMPIGYYIKLDTAFTMEEIDLCKGDCLYNSSDGYPDQFGGGDGRKFMSKNFKELLLSIHKKPMAEQREILNKTFDEWRGEIEQIDDVVVVGVRV